MFVLVFMLIIVSALLIAYVSLDDMVLSKIPGISKYFTYDDSRASDAATTGLNRVANVWKMLPWMIMIAVAFMAFYAAFTPVGGVEER